MTNKMLIDAAHPEETRVVVLRDSRVEEFDFESASRRQLRGNIYLAKVTRVEPSLQAAFVDYGGNRHGFLAFSEIHPDYYQIPVADRQALIEAEELENSQAEALSSEDDDSGSEGDAESSDDVDDVTVDEASGESQAESTAITDAVVSAAPAEQDGDADSEEDTNEELNSGSDEVVSDESVDSVGAEDALEEVPERKKPRIRRYKIQEVIKRRQVLLVQVVKEERGNKGAALTTYLSLAGRYSVLMPNTARGGGISRKITSQIDRKRLKKVATDLEVPEGMGIILRTAGASRTKAEVKRDFEYLLRLWENVRGLTLQSTAPALVYEEGSLIKRSIRDLYNKEIDEILVAGDEAYREAKDFMRMLMPSHAKNVKAYRDKQPLFASAGIEPQLDAMFSSQVTLKSGGYIVIDQTEALVSIDVNSGRATRERNIEDTAHQTNLEASDEIVRQLRLRDLAGLVVIDFIDMDEKRNNHSVERTFNEALKNDRARIQVGRISHFGLLEMSRQRIRTGVLESTTTTCPVCQGAGHIRAPASVALHVLRAIEDQLLRGVTHHLTVRARTPVALYILNQKRSHISELEQRFGLTITVMADKLIPNGTHFQIERGEPLEARTQLSTSVQPDSVVLGEDEDKAEVAAPETVAEQDGGQTQEGTDEQDETGVRKRRRRRRRKPSDGGGETPASPEATATDDKDDNGEPSGDENQQPGADSGDEDDSQQRKRRRGRRGGRGRRGRAGEEEGAPVAEDSQDAEIQTSYAESLEDGGQDGADPFEIDTTPVMEPRPERLSHEVPPEAAALSPDAPAPNVEEDTTVSAESGATATIAAEPEPVGEVIADETPSEKIDEQDDGDRPKRDGWWQRRSFF